MRSRRRLSGTWPSLRIRNLWSNDQRFFIQRLHECLYHSQINQLQLIYFPNIWFHSHFYRFILNFSRQSISLNMTNSSDLALAFFLWIRRYILDFLTNFNHDVKQKIPSNKIFIDFKISFQFHIHFKRFTNSNPCVKRLLNIYIKFNVSPL